MFFKCSSYYYNVIKKASEAKMASDVSPRITVSISLSNVAGALQSSKGITLNCQSSCPVVKAVFSLSSYWISTCQYPLFKSNVENHWFPSKHPGCRLSVVEDNCPLY
ncbi:hypothetical protein AVEN_230698-1 [Araneus ventricosus]|uniref:Uncharacterized protein n=1 Tax=Araneus ventricosus TaxID=182803 RepID=A0A4Y2A2S8_ARAVE|nr:hypothetical protein AVEN_230698-1 [Araneus ventricosus]